MASQQHLNILKSGVAAWNAWRLANANTRPDLSHAQLAGADLHGIDLHGADLAEADLGQANLAGSRLAGADLHRATLIQANLRSADFSRTNLREAALTHANIQGADFSRADVGGADLHSVHPDIDTIWPPLPRAATLQYFYLLRVPVLMGVTLFALPILSLTVFHSLLGNLLVLNRANIFWAMIATVTLAFSILVVFRIVLLNGMERFGVQQALTKDVISIPVLLLIEFLTLPMLVAIVFSNGQATDFVTVLRRLGAGLAGILVAHFLGYFALVIAVLFSQRYSIPADERFPVPFSWMKKLLRKAHDANLVSSATRTRLGDWGKTGSLAFRAGYFDPHTGLLYPGHWLSFASLIATSLLYLFIGHLKHARLGQDFDVPAIGYVILLLLLLTWILGMAAFFLDRYRIPLLAVLALLIWIGNKTPQSDHYYATQPGKPVAVTPGDVLTAGYRLAPDKAHPRGRVVLVATEGGGIQAAAWTAQVLTGLQQELHRTSSTNFGDSIALISSVSGGAVGTMFFVNNYQVDLLQHGFTVKDDQLDAIVDTSEKSSLDDIAWALAYPDFWRIFFPYTKSEKDRLVDRGLALEQTWNNSGNIHGTLNDWRTGVTSGFRPAVIFNSTSAETGEPFLLATTDLPENQISGVQRRTFSHPDRDLDIQLATAVRLAATFPYVSPAARALSNDPPFHAVDGGYYDNYGVYSLLDWLRQALLSTPENKRPDILIIQIRSFPPDDLSSIKPRGWFYQTWAPGQTLLSVRTTAQLVRDRDALRSFIEHWSGQNVKIQEATFEFSGGDAPLSWRMNVKQKQDIKNNWRQKIDDKQKNGEWLKVCSFFQPDPHACDRWK